MPQASPQFTPRQLLDAARRAEAEGKLDLAHQFYAHLSHHYGHTAEAAEGRQALAHLGAAEHYPQVWRANGEVAPTADNRPSARRAARGRHATRHRDYRLGRALAAVAGSIGWLLVGSGVLAIVAGLLAEFGQVAALQALGLSSTVLPHAVAAALVGGFTLLLGQAARALFDHASATRELLAIERAKAEREHP